MKNCGQSVPRGGGQADAALSAPKIRPSKVGKWRALALILVQVLIVAHVVHWKLKGETLSPLEPSESMQFTSEGVVNAGAILFALAILSTLVLGRWFCGWGCHILALQDFCRWLLGRVGIRPRLVNLGLLWSVPWLAFAYMFLLPVVARLVEGREFSFGGVQVYTADFWKTFPSLTVALLTFALCGFAIVYFLGSKGFCNFACPYGAIFGVADQLSPMRIRVTDACEGCGHCTAVCTSNVKVHQEVRDWKMVVDPGCMKCLDCVSVCPNGALHVGFGVPAIAARWRGDPAKRAAGAAGDRAWARWALLALFIVASFCVFTSFNGEVDAYVNPPDWRLIGSLSALSLAVAFVFRGKARRAAEYTLWEEILLSAAFLGATLAFRGLHGQVPFLYCMGLSVLFAWALVQGVRLVSRSEVRIQRFALKSAGAWRGPGFVFAAVMVLVLSGFVLASREQLVLRAEGRPAFARMLFNLGVASAQGGSTEAAIAQFRRALVFDPASIEARENLAGMLCQSGRFAEGVEQYEIALAQNPSDPDTHALCAQALVAERQLARALPHLLEAVRLAPDRTDLRQALAEIQRILGNTPGPRRDAAAEAPESPPR